MNSVNGPSLHLYSYHCPPPPLDYFKVPSQCQIKFISNIYEYFIIEVLYKK